MSDTIWSASSSGRPIVRRPIPSAAYPQVQAYESGLPLRTVVVEFDSYEIALKAHQSEAYQKALGALGAGADRDFRIVEGT